MFFTVNDPGPWQFYVKRADNIGLPIMEIKQKYLQEQALFENEQRRQYYEYMRMIEHSRGGAGGSGGGSIVFSGQGIDGPIAGATVTALAEGVTTTTDANGSFGFTFIPAGGFELTGGSDTVTGVDFTGTLKAPSGSTIISPITTAIKEVMDLGNTEADATNAVFDMAREIYGIDIDSSVYERVKTENFINLAETDANMLKVAGFASFLESSAEVTGEQVNQQFSDETLKSGKEAFYKSLAGQANNYKTQLRPGSGVNWDSFGVGNTTGRSVRQNIVRLTGYSGRPGNLNAYNIIEPALQTSLDRVREVVNDTNIDKNYGVTTVMTQNRIAKRDLKSEVTKYGGSISMANLQTSASRFVQENETTEAENLGTIFAGKTNRRAPEANKFPATISYISGSSRGNSSQLNFGNLTRGAEFNGAPRYTGVVGGESTLVWYDSTNRSWVIDNNLTLPAIARSERGQAYPLSGQSFKTTDSRTIELIASGSHTIADAPAGPGRYINSLVQPRSANGAINFTSVSSPSTSGGVTTWTATGQIHIATLDLGATKANRTGITLTADAEPVNGFTITKNANSPLYVISKSQEGAIEININGLISAVTRLSLGVQLDPRRGAPALTGGFNALYMTDIGGIFET